MRTIASTPQGRASRAAFNPVGCLRREADDRLTFPPALSEGGEDVVGGLEVELELVGALAVDLLPGRVAGAEVGGGGGHDEDVGESRSRPSASASSAAVSTSTRRTPPGAGNETLAATRVTSAPRPGRSARAMPIRPLERLPMKRTGSIGSRVPPAQDQSRRP